MDLSRINRMIKKYAKTKLGTLVKTSFIDYPNKISTALFLKGCNMRCEYCHNKDLLTNEGNQDESFIALEELISFLEKRKNIIEYFVLSGGEASQHPLFALLYCILKYKYKLFVKLDTNALNQGLTISHSNIEDYFDYYAIDLKTDIFKYKEVFNLSVKQYDIFYNNILSFIWSRRPIEFRTTVYPPYFPSENENIPINLYEIALFLEKNRNSHPWYIQQFKPGNCYSDTANKELPYQNELISYWITDILQKRVSFRILLR